MLAKRYGERVGLPTAADRLLAVKKPVLTTAPFGASAATTTPRARGSSAGYRTCSCAAGATAANPASASLNPGAANRKDGETRQLDLQARLELGVGRELIAEVRNATDEDKVNYFGPNLDIVRDYNSYGRQFWVGFAFKG